MKSISSFLSQDGIVLEELILGLDEKNILFQPQTALNKFGDGGCVHLVGGLKKNKSVKILNLECIAPFNTFFDHFFDHFQFATSLLKE